MLRVGIVGVGFMGMIHYLGYQRVKGMKVGAVVSRDSKKRAGDWRGIQGNFGPPGEKMDLGDAKGYETLDQLLDDPKIDIVDICLPPAAHVEAVVRSFQAGKHVFCEKPLALNVPECRRMQAAAKKAGKMLFVGHVLPFFPEFTFARKTIESGKYGKLLGGHFKRTISDPTWLKDFYNPDITGGPLLDLHVHDAHYIRMLCGMPKAVTSQGRMRGEVVESFNTQFQFEDPNLLVTASGGVIRQQGRAFTHAFEIALEKATLLYDFAVIGGEAKLLMPLTVLDSRGKTIVPELPTGDAITPFELEIKEVQKGIASGVPSPILGGDLAVDAVVLCQKQTQSVQTGKTVKV